MTGSPSGLGRMAATFLAIIRAESPCRDWRISSGAVNPRWRIWFRALILVSRAERLATTSARIASTLPSLVLAAPSGSFRAI